MGGAARAGRHRDHERSLHRRRLASLRRVARRADLRRRSPARVRRVEGALDRGRRHVTRLLHDRLDRDLPGGAPVPERQDLEPRRAERRAGRADRVERAHAGADDRRPDGAGRGDAGRRARVPRGVRQVRDRRGARDDRRADRARRDAGADRAREAPEGHVRGRRLHRRRRPRRRPLRDPREDHDHGRRVHLRLHRLAPAGPRTGEQHLHRPALRRAGGLQGGHESRGAGEPRLLRAAARSSARRGRSSRASGPLPARSTGRR